MQEIKNYMEDIIDRQIINDYEKREKNGEVKFVNSDDIIKQLKTI